VLSRLLPTGLLCAFLMGCAMQPPPRAELSLPPSLLAACVFIPPEPETNAQLLKAYESALAAFAACSARHQALIEALP
jgi:hypothetical protein